MASRQGLKHPWHAGIHGGALSRQWNGFPSGIETFSAALRQYRLLRRQWNGFPSGIETNNST